jgi:hypothetical protein
MVWFLADLVLRTNNFTEVVMVIRVHTLITARHALVTGGHELARILFPGVERLPFVIVREVIVSDNIVGTVEMGGRIFDFCVFSGRIPKHDFAPLSPLNR